MAQRREIITVYAAGLIQGVALVTFPAASAVFTSSRDYGLSKTEYGAMFVPQAVMAIASSLLGARACEDASAPSPSICRDCPPICWPWPCWSRAGLR